MQRSMLRRLVLVAMLGVGALVSLERPALAGPAWIAVEAPARPWGHGQDGPPAMLVHLRGHVDEHTKVEAVAEGIVAGKRRQVQLVLEPTDDPGVLAVRPTWPQRGRWILVFRADGHVASWTTVDLGKHGLRRHRVAGHEAFSLHDVSIRADVGELSRDQVDAWLTAQHDAPTIRPGSPQTPTPWPAGWALGALLSAVVVGASVWRVRSVSGALAERAPVRPSLR